MALGPIEMLVVKFPRATVGGDVVPALRQLVESGTIRIVDILFIRKDAGGEVQILEINDLEDEQYAIFDPIVSDITALLSREDAQQFAAALGNDSSAGLMLFENTWATRFRDAVLDVGGELVMSERIPKAVIDELVAAEVSA